MTEGTVIELLSSLLIFAYTFSNKYGTFVGWSILIVGITSMIVAAIILKHFKKD